MNFNEFCESNKIETETPSKKEFSKNDNLENFENNTQKTQNSAQKASNQSKNTQSFDEEAVKEKLKKYQNMTEEELKKQLLIEGKKQKANGTIDDKTLDNIRDSLSPLLSSEQQNRLEELLKLLKWQWGDNNEKNWW